MNRKMGLLFAAVVAFSAQGSVIVHDAARDLVCNLSCRAVFTNFYGGVWSYMRASTYDGVRSLMPGVRERVSTSEFDSIGDNYVWQRGPAKSDSSTPCFGVNPTAWPDSNTFMRGANYPAIPPGQLSCHPGNTTDAGNQCCVLRFTVPRDGNYEVRAKVWNQNTGWIASALFVNGVEVVSRKAWWSEATAVKTNDFSRAASTYRVGDVIELSFDGNGTYNANATGFTFDVCESVDGDVIDANACFLANKTSLASANPFFDEFGEWIAQYGDGTSMSRSTMADGYVRTTQGADFKGCAKDGQLPYLVINANGVMSVEKNGEGKPTFMRGNALLAGEFLAHPGADLNTYFRLVPARGGIYDIGITARDLARSASQKRAAGGGVNVSLLQGGVKLATIYVGTEDPPAGDSVFVRDVAVVPNVPIEVCLDNNGAHASDSTGIFWSFVPRGDLPSVYDANAAMKANMTSESPAATWTYNGAEWSVGICNGGWAGAFTEFTVRQNVRYNGTTEGWGETMDTSPFVCVNKSGRPLTSADLGTGSAGVDMLIAHPKSDNSAPAIRVKVPETGVYAATGWFNDLDGRGVGTDQNKEAAGVDVHLVANGHSAASGVARSERSEHPYVRLAQDHIHLRAGETVAFAVGSNGAHPYDLTGFYAWLERETAACHHVSFDFDVAPVGGVAATFKGMGRVGWSGERWNSIMVADGAASAVSSSVCREMDDTATRKYAAVTLTLARTGGLAATAQGTATDTSAPALFTDGVVSTGVADATMFEVKGLLPGESYDFVFYSRAFSGTPASSNTVVRGVFAVGNASGESSSPWFAADLGDYARVSATADANGTVTGTFASARDASAVWCGLQILGSGFVKADPPGALIILR